MLFNSLEFLIFFPVVTLLYFMLPHRHRWWMLLTASCVFYMAFIPVYIFILLITILIDYFAGMWIENSSGSKRKVLLWVSIVSTCLVLFIFKYFDFFNANFALAARFLRWNYPVEALKIILPIGLSFHTFQSLSYVVEVYRGRQKAERHFGIYALYVMFYPQLVAGPIERPQNLLHQFYEQHTFDYERVTNGLKLMAWGLFKKVVIADRLAVFVNTVFDHPHDYTGGSFIAATVFFAFQIYCDFSGYSEIAIGSAQVMGFRLMTNFNRPYYAKSISEFWKRWHISLSSWFKDYVYIPLGGNRTTRSRLYFNLMVTFLLSGLWHGANWTYVVWGGLNGVYLIAGAMTQAWREKAARVIGLSRVPALHALIKMATTFCLISFAWVFFRARSLPDAFFMIGEIGRAFGTAGDADWLGKFFMGQPKKEFLWAVLLITLLESVHLIQRKGSFRVFLKAQPVWLRWPAYYGVVYGILLFGAFNASAQFIYFQF